MKRISALLLLTALVWYGFHMANPPAPLPADAPETAYSAHRAFAHVENIARAPHPLGTPEHERVRDYLINELREMGVQADVLSGITSSRFFGGAAHVQNIFASVPGSDPEKTIMLMAHYDTVPNAPGAGDDASGVAAILETVRALTAEGTPKNNVWILFTDGEERGLLGARYFVDYHPGADSVDLVMNVEARGSSGPSFMFETSNPNRSLLTHFARSATYPVANSLTYTVYKLLPNDTDLSVTKEAGLPGLNFAFAEDHLNYHTMQDTPSNLSLASLQHHGENLLPVLRHFASRDFDLTQEGEMVYFNSLSGGLAHYPAGWSLPLAGVVLAVFLAWLAYLLRTGRLGAGRWLGSTAFFLLAIAAGAALTRYGWDFLSGLHPQYRWLAHGEVYPHAWYLAAFTALMLLILIPLFGWLQKRWNMEAPLSGVFTVWTLLGAAAAWYLPTAAYLFTWPAMMALAGWIVLGDSIADRSWGTLGILFLGLLAALYMVPPYVQSVQVMMTTNMLFVSMSVLLLLAGLCWPLIRYITAGQQRYWVGGLALVTAACLAGASLNSGFDAEHKKQNSLLYLADVDTGEAWWLSQNHATDTWTRQFLGEDPERGAPGGFQTMRGGNDYLYAPAEYLDGDSLAIALVADSLGDSLRHTRLRFRSPSGGNLLRMRVEEDTEFRTLSLNGTSVSQDGGSFSRSGLLYFGNLSNPLEIDFTLAEADSAVLLFEMLRPGFPPELMEGYEGRAPHMMPVPGGATDATILRKTLRLQSPSRN